jgi:hypothetical protein
VEYIASNLHSRLNFWHCMHLGVLGSHLIFFSRQVLHACPRRFLGLPALVVPHLGLKASTLLDLCVLVPSS